MTEFVERDRSQPEPFAAQAVQLVSRLHDDALVAEAALVAAGWRFLTVDGLTVDSQADLDRYEQVLAAFDDAAAGRERRHQSTSSCLTVGIRGPDAEQRIAWLRERIAELNPASFWGGRQWDLRDAAR